MNGARVFGLTRGDFWFWVGRRRERCDLLRSKNEADRKRLEEDLDRVMIAFKWDREREVAFRDYRTQGDSDVKRVEVWLDEDNDLVIKGVDHVETYDRGREMARQLKSVLVKLVKCEDRERRIEERERRIEKCVHIVNDAGWNDELDRKIRGGQWIDLYVFFADVKEEKEKEDALYRDIY